MNTKQKTLWVGAIILVVISMFVGGEVKQYVGSAVQGNDYHATSTASNAVYGAFTGDKLVKTGHGSLGSVIITGANTGIVNFYNATTSDVTKRTGNKASTTQLMVSIPASTVAGAYVFDVEFTDGLLVELESGNMPTTTITYR